MRVQVVPVERREPPRGVLLAPEELDDPHPAEPLLQKCVEPGQAHPDIAEGLAHPAAEDPRREPHQRDHGEGDQREPPVEGEHHRHDRDQREGVAEDR